MPESVTTTIDCSELTTTEIDDLRHSLQKSRYHFEISEVIATGTYESLGGRPPLNLLNLHTTLLVQFSVKFTHTKQGGIGVIVNSIDDVILKSAQQNRESTVTFGLNGKVLVEIQKSTSGRRRKRQWSRGERLTVVGIAIAVVGIAVAAISGNPEVRRFFGLEALPRTTQTETPNQSTPTVQSAEPTQKTTTHVRGNDNVAGNNLSGDNDVTGNNNRTGPTANAPNGIAITGGTVTNPTVNNYGPPPVQLTWSASDAPAEAPTGQFAKAVIVKSNTSYSPVSILIFSDIDIENLKPIGIAMDEHIGHLNNDKKGWFLRIGNPPVTPSSPLTVIVISKTPFNILGVQRLETKQP